MTSAIRRFVAGLVSAWFVMASAAAADVHCQGLWWNAPAGSESGWGINFAHQGNTVFPNIANFGSATELGFLA